MKIYDYNTEKFINEEEIKTGMKLRIEGKPLEVERLLEQINHKESTKGHETDTVKRVYIEVLKTEIQTKEYLSNKEFKEKIRRAERFESIEGIPFEKLILRTMVWHTGDGVFGEIFIQNEDYEPLVDMAFIDGANLHQTLDNEENTIDIKKATKKLLVKYKKWCENFEIQIEDIKEETC